MHKYVLQLLHKYYLTWMHKYSNVYILIKIFVSYFVDKLLINLIE